MTKEAEAYCKASIAVDNDQYLKENFCKLRKYKKVLTNPIPHGIDQSPMSYERLARLQRNLKQEIERRKTKYKDAVVYIAKGVLIGVLVGIILLFLHFLLSLNQGKQNIPQPQLPQPQQKAMEQKAIPTESKSDQLKQKSK